MSMKRKLPCFARLLILRSRCQFGILSLIKDVFRSYLFFYLIVTTVIN